MKKPNITIRYGALADDIIVDGKCFDRSKLDKRQSTFLRNVVIDALVAAGAVTRRVAA